jgi:hypothetical protein
MKELIKSVSEDLAESILSETFIDANLVQVKIESALKVLISQSKKPNLVNMQFMANKMTERNKQAQIDAIEKNFWKTIAKTYIGELHIKEYYERLNLMLKNEGI